MTAKIITAVLILIANLALGAAYVLFMMLSLNGFSERASNYAFAVMIGGGLAVTLAATLGGYLLAGFLLKKEWHPALAAALAAAAFIAAGFILKAVLFFAGLFAAEAARTTR